MNSSDIAEVKVLSELEAMWAVLAFLQLGFYQCYPVFFQGSRVHNKIKNLLVRATPTSGFKKSSVFGQCGNSFFFFYHFPPAHVNMLTLYFQD